MRNFVITVKSNRADDTSTGIKRIGISETDSRAIYASLRSAAAFDANVYLVKDLNDMTNLVALIPPSLTRFAQVIGNQFNVAYSQHQFSAATNRRTRAPSLADVR